MISNSKIEKVIKYACELVYNERQKEIDDLEQDMIRLRKQNVDLIKERNFYIDLYRNLKKSIDKKGIKL